MDQITYDVYWTSGEEYDAGIDCKAAHDCLYAEVEHVARLRDKSIRLMFAEVDAGKRVWPYSFKESIADSFNSYQKAVYDWYTDQCNKWDFRIITITRYDGKASGCSPKEDRIAWGPYEGKPFPRLRDFLTV